MFFKRLAKLLAVVLALSFLSGCVYLRLLSFKHQLKDFDEKVQIDQSAGLAFIFTEPLLKDSDFVFITDSEPTHIQELSHEPKIEDWEWVFEKKMEDDSGDPFNIAFHTRFEDGLLTRIGFDPQLLEAIPQEFIIELFRSLGNAKINNLRRTATAAMNRENLDGVELPSMADISHIMGRPTLKAKKNKRGLFRYVFNFYNPKNRDLSGQFAIVFQTDSDNLDQEIYGFELTGKGH